MHAHATSDRRDRYHRADRGDKPRPRGQPGAAREPDPTGPGPAAPPALRTLRPEVTTRLLTAALAALVGAHAAGCSTGRGEAAPLPGSVASARSASVCPMDVPGTTVASLDVPSGAEVTFTTSDPSRVAELRYRVRALADLRNDRLSGLPPGSAPPLPVASMGAGPAGRPGASWAAVEDVERGSRMTVTTENPPEVGRLQDSIRGRVQRLAQGGGCAGDWMP